MTAIIALPVMVGWILGGIVNYLSDTLPVRRRLTLPFCWNCQATIPLVNYAFWPRKCPACSAPRKFRTWIIEALAIVCSIWLWNDPVQTWGYGLSLLLLTYFLLVIVIDIERRLILHIVSIVGAILGLWVGYLSHGLTSTLLGGAVGFLIMLALYLLGFFFMNIMRRRRNVEMEGEALGFGDVNLGGVIGLTLGWPGVLMGIVLAVFLAGCISLIYLVVALIGRRYKPDLAIPYGPFLSISAIALLYFKDAFWR